MGTKEAHVLSLVVGFVIGQPGRASAKPGAEPSKEPGRRSRRRDEIARRVTGLFLTHRRNYLRSRSFRLGHANASCFVAHDFCGH